MFSSATKVKGQGVGSAYLELIRLLEEHHADSMKVSINKFGKADISHYHTIDPLFYLSHSSCGRPGDLFDPGRAPACGFFLRAEGKEDGAGGTLSGRDPHGQYGDPADHISSGAGPVFRQHAFPRQCRKGSLGQHVSHP